MPRIRRGGQRVRAAGGRTRKEDCCCEPIPCETINDEPTRATWEIQYEIVGYSVGTQGCGASCTSEAPLSGVVPYVGGGFSEDWDFYVPICSNYFFRVTGGIRCTSGNVAMSLAFRVAQGTPPTLTTIWSNVWTLTVAESLFILGTEFTLTDDAGIAPTASVCLPIPLSGAGTTCKFTVVVA